jgi:signal transduction histidine kinase/DNA-binding response OmpR family regulator
LANRLVLLATIPIFLLAAAAIYVAYAFAQTERSEQAWVVHTYQVIDATRALLSDAKDAETGQRGYLLTHKPEYLAPFHKAGEAIARDLSRFKTLTRDNPNQQQRAGQLKQLMERRLDFLDRAIKISTPAAAASPEVIQILDQGKASMDAIRAIVGHALGDEHWLLGQRTQAARTSEEKMFVSALVGAVLAFLVVMLATILLMRYNRTLKRSEAERAHQANILQATLDSIRDGIAVFETDNTLAAFNLNFFHLLNFPPELAYIGAPIEKFRVIDNARSAQVLPPVTAKGQEIETGYQRITRAGRELDVYRTLVPNDGFLIAALDVSARVRTEASLRQAQKMEAVGHLTGGVAHDFNNLLQVVSANLDLMANDAKGNPQSAQRLQNAIAAVSRGSRLTAQLLAFARRQALEPRSTNLGRLLQEMTDLLRRTLGERIEVEAIAAGGLWNTQVDPNQVENAILNLAINSRDAMPDGGKLTIELTNAYLDDEYAAQHEEVTAGQYVMLAVSDTGQGMSPELVGRVFEPFFTTKPEGQGTGLGLSQVYGFVKQTGGHIKIYSEAGQGTTVKLYLPRTKKPEEDLSPVALSPIEGGSETILVVEDDEGVRAAVADMLAELGYSVLRAEDASQALTVLASGALVNLLFTDVVMPGPIPTREFVRRAQALQPKIKVLYTSGYTQNAIVHDGRLDEGLALLSKPYRRDELARKVRTILSARGQVVPPPPVKPTAPERAALAQAANDDKSTKTKILVVEDVALIRMTTVDMVEELGYRAVEAADGPQAVILLKQDADIAILLTDLGLPGMSGNELVEHARELRPDVRIVVASGYSSDGQPGTTTLEGARFLAKPFDMEQLRRALKDE